MAGRLNNHDERQPLLAAQRPLDMTPVYPIIQMMRKDAMQYIDTPLSPETLSAPDIVYSVIVPLEEKYKALQQSGNYSIVFCLLLNRAYFLRDRNLISSALSRTRAALCEKLAIRAIHTHATNMLELALALTTSWPVYSGADPILVARAREERDDDLEERVGNAIEVAIISQARTFIKSQPFQKVIDGIWSGKIVYQAESNRSILSDTYKRNPVHFYDPHKAPLLDHYRLKVPAIRSVLEYLNFLILFILFILALEFNERDKLNIWEIIFMVYSLGFSLEKIAAMQEHGIKVYSKGTWNGFDIAFVTLYCTYAVLRLLGVYHHRLWARATGIDCLALIAVLMFPRLAFVTLKNNLMVLSLRAMIVQFVVLMMLAAFCFGGFLYALWTLSRNGAAFTVGQTAWWMLDIFFGLDASGFDHSTQYHPTFGPIVMVIYACLSNTLLVTVLVSILSHTFSTISDDAQAEAMFRRAVSTIEGVKADSLFSYQPPINLVALCIMLPASYILSPRWFHKVNVFMIRLTSFPILLLIAIYERQAKQSGAMTFYETVSSAAEKILDTLPRSLKRFSFFEGLAGSDADIDAIFELEDELDNESAIEIGDASTGPVPPVDFRQRRGSMLPRPRGLSTSSVRPPRVSPPGSPRKQETAPLPRTRVNSLITRGIELASSAPSPLAQMYQPMVFGDDGDVDPQAQGEGAYGPRRRMSSLQRRDAGAGAPSQIGQGARRFPALTESPDGGNSYSHSRPRPEPASRVVADADEDGGGAGMAAELLEKRFDRMEERQKRIEEMLAHLTASLRR